jgi:hypothetical protein
LCFGEPQKLVAGVQDTFRQLPGQLLLEHVPGQVDELCGGEGLCRRCKQAWVFLEG